METVLVHDPGFQYQVPFVWNWLPLKGCFHRHDGLFATPKASHGPRHNRQREVVWRNSPLPPPTSLPPRSPSSHPRPLPCRVTSGLLKSSISSLFSAVALILRARVTAGGRLRVVVVSISQWIEQHGMVCRVKTWSCFFCVCVYV